MPLFARRRKIRPGNALLVVLAISFMVGIQLYIVRVYSSGSYRHVEKVNAHVRAIFVGESAFSSIVARLKAGRWQDRWFKAGPVMETDVPVFGGTYSSYVATASETPEKLVDVWLEGHFGTAIAPMYYRVLFTDDSLDFTAQVYPRFFTFLDANNPTPFNGPAGRAAALIQNEINQQHDNESNALSALNSTRNTMDLHGIGADLNMSFPGEPLDIGTPFGQPSLSQPPYLASLQSQANSFPMPPPLPPPPANTGPPSDFLQNFSSCFASNTGLSLPSGTFSGDPSAYYAYFGNEPTFSQVFVANWNRTWNHQPTVFDHCMKVGESFATAPELTAVIRAMVEQYAANPLSAAGLKIQLILLCVLRDLVPGVADLSGVSPPAVNINLVDPTLGGVFNEANFGTVFAGYRDWWKTVKGI